MGDTEIRPTTPLTHEELLAVVDGKTDRILSILSDELIGIAEDALRPSAAARQNFNVTFNASLGLDVQLSVRDTDHGRYLDIYLLDPYHTIVWWKSLKASTLAQLQAMWPLTPHT